MNQAKGLNDWAAAKVRDLVRRAALMGAAEMQAIARRAMGGGR
jgi:hypothetical protein